MLHSFPNHQELDSRLSIRKLVLSDSVGNLLEVKFVQGCYQPGLGQPSVKGRRVAMQLKFAPEQADSSAIEIVVGDKIEWLFCGIESFMKQVENSG